jgi:hypothetical protein
MNRRNLLGAIFAASVAPAYVKAGILMPVRKIIVPDSRLKISESTRYVLERLSQEMPSLAEVSWERPIIMDCGLPLGGGYVRRYTPQTRPSPEQVQQMIHDLRRDAELATGRTGEVKHFPGGFGLGDPLGQYGYIAWKPTP